MVYLTFQRAVIGQKNTAVKRRYFITVAKVRNKEALPYS
tara:strand:+ start:12044 stop:12160 length:117 start_codon:yes stop_codon:yes gene_type:complete